MNGGNGKIFDGEKIFKDIISGRAGLTGYILRAGLRALSPVYAQGTAIRNAKYDKEGGITVPAPVISIGNITAGGTGKTPMVQYVCRFFEEHDKHPVILSRGYKSKGADDITIVAEDGKLCADTTTGGDEPVLLARELQHTGIIVGRKRTETAKVAINRLHGDVLVLDDGFQHRALNRNLDVVLIDAANPFGYEYVLPGGVLREPLDGLKRADGFVLTKTNLVGREDIFQIKRTLSKYAPGVPVVQTIHKPLGLFELHDWADGDKTELGDAYKDKKVLAVSGIGSPKSFTKTLTSLGYNVVGAVDLGDHHKYDTDSLVRIYAEMFATKPEVIITTEKDAVKLSQLAATDDLKIPILVLPIGIEFTEGEEKFCQILSTVGKVAK